MQEIYSVVVNFNSVWSKLCDIKIFVIARNHTGFLKSCRSHDKNI
jgi:hypothetical protein